VSRINIDKMSYRELLELQGAVASAIVARKEEEKADLKRKLAELADQSGFAMDELFGGRRGRKTSGGTAIKYRNPKDASQTWTGRGRKPNWLVEALKKGQKLDNFLAA